MGGAALVAAVLAAPVKHADVRVKSRHDKAVAETGGVECLKVGAEQILRGAAIGPGPVHLSLRRLAAPGAKPLAVTVTRDGREVERLSLDGKGVQAFRDEIHLASAPAERAIDIPSGPHTLFIEVGPGEGHAFGAVTRWRIIPSVGATAGVGLSTAGGQGYLGPIHQTEARLAVGAAAAVELPVGAGRLGAEVRYLYATTGASGVAQNFQVGGALVQAAWRFGL